MSTTRSQHRKLLNRVRRKERGGEVTKVNCEKVKILEYLFKLLDGHGHKAGIVMEMSEYLESNRRLLDEQSRPLEKLLEEEKLSDRSKNPSRASLGKLRKLIRELLQH
jgi:hypothetical protein